jgi:hypothetical protein
VGAVARPGPGRRRIGGVAHHPLSASFRDQARACRRSSPLYWQLLNAMAADLDAGGVTATVLAGREHDRLGTVPALRLLGALHRLVLTGQAPELAGYYPSVGGTLAAADTLWPAAERTLRDQVGPLRELLGRTVQTNEPGRASVLYGGLYVSSQRAARAAGRPGAMPVRLLEVGASGGLTMLADRYAYAVGERVLGDPDSLLRFEQPWIGLPAADLDVPPVIVERRGCDPAPVDPVTPEGRLTLMSYVWADWLERVHRLEAALAVAAGGPPTPVDRAGLGEWLARQLAEARPGVLTVVWHSVMWQYVEAPERRRALDLMAAAGARSTPDAPVAHLRFEPVWLGRDRLAFQLLLTLWPGDGGDIQLGTAPGHGLPTTWQVG